MDENKRGVLVGIGYSIQPACGLCTHYSGNSGQVWATCNAQTYEHLKHTGPDRQLSVFAYGSCPSFEVSPGLVDQLGGFKEFVRA